MTKHDGEMLYLDLPPHLMLVANSLYETQTAVERTKGFDRNRPLGEVERGHLVGQLAIFEWLAKEGKNVAMNITSGRGDAWDLMIWHNEKSFTVDVKTSWSHYPVLSIPGMDVTQRKWKCDIYVKVCLHMLPEKVVVVGQIGTWCPAMTVALENGPQSVKGKPGKAYKIPVDELESPKGLLNIDNARKLTLVRQRYLHPDRPMPGSEPVVPVVSDDGDAGQGVAPSQESRHQSDQAELPGIRGE
jgi:hypothetical protein